MLRLAFSLLLLAAPAAAEPPPSVRSDAEAAAEAAMHEIVHASFAPAPPMPFRTPFRGELAETHPSGFGPLPSADRVVIIDSAQAVARIPAHAAWPDLYFFLDRQTDGTWRATAVRSLALPPFIHMMRDGLRGQAALGEEERRLLANVELTMRSDLELRAWFSEHRMQLERIRTLARAVPHSGGGERPLADLSVTTGLQALNLSGATIAGDGTVRVTIGGVQDNSVGLLHPGNWGSLPTISRIEYIWVEELENGWFLFRTT
jgi:hypothetical protein